MNVFRLLVLFGLLFLPFRVSGQNALILIQHDQAGPNLLTANYYIHAEWIRWAPEQRSLYNRILSLASGVDLRAEQADAGFKSVGDGTWRSENGERLRRRGFFEARRHYLGSLPVVPLRKSAGGLSPSVLLLALAEPNGVIHTASFEGEIPTNGLVVAEATKWDEAIGLAKRVSGRVLIVEYPPKANESWSRFWKRGEGWPEGVPVERDLHVPGLVRGRQALALLVRPESFAWRPNDAGNWGGPNRWLEHGEATTPRILLGWFAWTAFVVAWALAQVMNEDRGPFVSELLVFTALAPAALVVTGSASRLGGLESWPIVLLFVWCFLYALTWAVSLAQRRVVPEAHPLWGVCAVGLACFVLFDPLWSDLSGRWGAVDLDVSGQALGVFLAYLTGFCAFARGRWLGRAAVAALLLAGLTINPWWVAGHSSLLIVPALALIAAEGLFRLPILLALALLPTGLARAFENGVVWSPDGLHLFADGPGALNLWQTLILLFSPSWFGLLATVSIGLLVGNRFLAYRLHRLLRHDPRLRSLLWAAAGVAALGVTEPLALPAAPVAVFAALIALGYDGLRANA